MPTSSTLQQITYQNLQQLIDDLNSNFSIIQNSPYFKGIPGLDGNEGPIGPQGERGTKFIFVANHIDSLKNIFPTISGINDVTLNFLNTIVNDFQQSILLYSCLSVDSFVNKDIVVLGNTLMLQYDKEHNMFVSTGKYFNQEVEIMDNIDAIVYQLLNDAIANLSNPLFTRYNTLGKNYSDNNSTAINLTLTNTTVYSPYIINEVPATGIDITNHKFISYTDYEDNINKTLIAGPIKKYYEQLHNTIKNLTTQQLNSSYAPGVLNMPQIVMMQNNDKNGFYFGLKDDDNLFNYGSLFKDGSGNVVLKSHSSDLPIEYSKLVMGRNKLFYDKNFQVGKMLYANNGNMNYGYNNRLFAGYRDTDYSEFLTFDNVINKWTLKVENNKIENNADNIFFYKQARSQNNVVLVIDENGKLMNKMRILTEYVNYSLMTELTIPTGKHIKTLRNYVDYVAMTNYIHREFRQFAIDEYAPISNSDLPPFWFIADGNNGTDDASNYFPPNQQGNYQVVTIQYLDPNI